MDGGAWWATVLWVTKSWTRLSDLDYFLLIKEVSEEFAYLSEEVHNHIP